MSQKPIEPAPIQQNGMAEFVSVSIYEAIGRIGSQFRPLYLPAIQRHFVWRQEQICRLFDSMLRGYPIGTFLFWEVENEKRNDYAYYEFIKDYSQHQDDCNNRTAPRTLPPDVTGVLDGQQRLNSMYVALVGSYASYFGGTGCPRTNRAYFPQRRFYLNVYFSPEDTEDVSYQFEFLRDEDALPAKFTSKECWFPVHSIYHCSDDKEVDAAWEKFCVTIRPEFTLLENKSADAVAALRLLRAKIRDDKIITYFPVRRRDLTEALKIFIRANNGGTSVQQAEMIFSTIVAHWDVGRQRIEALVSELNGIGNRFEFNVSTLMLACLALSGCPIRLKIESFKPSHVEQIKKSWDEIARSLRVAVQWFDEWGFSGNNKVNLNAVIAVALFVQRHSMQPESKAELEFFVIKSLLCELYRRHESVLNLIREYAQNHVPLGSAFSSTHFESHFVLPSGMKMQVTADLLERLLLLPIHEPRTFIVLSLLHPQHALHQHVFHKDHIHPHARFDDLSRYALDREHIERWHDWKNRLPNLQLLQGQVNSSKQATPFADWINANYPEPKARGLYLAANDIPPDVSFDFRDFEAFYEARRNLLRSRLAVLLDVDISTLSQEIARNQPALQ